MTQIAKNYADALYELAESEGLTEELYLQLRGVRDVFHEEPDYLRILSAANLPLTERLGVLDRTFSDRIHPYVRNFLKILTERGHIGELKNCFVRFRARYAEDRNILEATAITAVPIGAAAVDKLAKKLGEITGKKVEMDNRVDPGVLGGVRLEYAGHALDGTLRQRLEGIEKTLSDTV